MEPAGPSPGVGSLVMEPAGPSPGVDVSVMDPAGPSPGVGSLVMDPAGPSPGVDVSVMDPAGPSPGVGSLVMDPAGSSPAVDVSVMEPAGPSPGVDVSVMEPAGPSPGVGSLVMDPAGPSPGVDVSVMDPAGPSPGVGSLVMEPAGPSPGVGSLVMEPAGPSPGVDVSVMEPAGPSPGVDVSVMEPAGPSPGVDVSVMDPAGPSPGVGSLVMEPAGPSPGVGSLVMEPARSSPGVDVSVMEPAGPSPGVDVSVMEPAGPSPGVDVSVMDPAGPSPGVGSLVMEPAGPSPGVGSLVMEPARSSPGVDVSVMEPAGPSPGVDVSVMDPAGPSPGVGSLVMEPAGPSPGVGSLVMEPAGPSPGVDVSVMDPAGPSPGVGSLVIDPAGPSPGVDVSVMDPAGPSPGVGSLVMEPAGPSPGVGSLVMEPAGPSPGVDVSVMEPAGPSPGVDVSVMEPAGPSPGVDVSVMEPAGPSPGVDVSVMDPAGPSPGVGSLVMEPAGPSPGVGSLVMEPARSSPGVDVSVMEPAGPSPGVDVSVMEPAGPSPGVDVSVMDPAGPSPGVGSLVMEPAGPSPGVGSLVMEPVRSSPGVDVSVMEPAGPSPGVDVSVMDPAGPSPGVGPEFDLSLTDLLEPAPALLEIAPMIEALDMLSDNPESVAFQDVAPACAHYEDRNGDSSKSQLSETGHIQTDHTETKQKRARTKTEQIAAHAAKHQVKEVPERCRRDCKNRCCWKIKPSWRESINEAVNGLSKEARRQWYRTHVKSIPARCRRKENRGRDDSRKKNSFRWMLPADPLAPHAEEEEATEDKEDDEEEQEMASGDNSVGRCVDVCKPFFLTTLGFNEGSDAAVMSAVGKGPICATDISQRPEPVNKVDDEKIVEHIMSFRPVKHHYRYEHAPHRLYLPTDITLQTMYSDYLRGVSEGTLPACSRERYRQSMQRLNIGNTRLSGEECAKCSAHIRHMEEAHGEQVTEPNAHKQGCDVYLKHKEHLETAKSARHAYRADADRQWQPDEIILSADMMKVTLLPVLPLKVCIFSPRIIAYNETFAVVMPEARKDKLARRELQEAASVCVLWHEGETGRSCEDVAAAFFLYMSTACRNMKHVTVWADNCSGQNKNWTLCTALLQLVHAAENAIDKVTMKFFEPGHTSMAADAVHQTVSKKIRAKEKLEDFDDYTDVVNAAGVKSLRMEPGRNMLELKDGVSRGKLKALQQESDRPYLADFKVIEVRAGSELLYTKKQLNQTSFRAYDLMKNSFDVVDTPELVTSTCPPAAREKALHILKHLAPHMMPHKRLFWEALVVNDGDSNGKKRKHLRSEDSKEKKRRATK